MQHDAKQLRIGLLYALTCYTVWGLVPAYFKLLAGMKPLHILAHRVFWSVLVLLPLISRRGLWGEVRAAFASRRVLLELAASTLFISVNWFSFVYAISIGQVMETSLGYYINPLVSVAMGVVLLKERMRPGQIAAITLGISAVAILTISTGRVPVLALVMAFSFAFYGFVRKLAHVSPLAGLFVETLLLFPLATVGVLIWTAPAMPQYFPSIANAPLLGPIARATIIAASGVVTAIPLLWFANATKRLPLVMIGLMQYLAPTISFLQALLLFHERFTFARKIAFPLIWMALLIFSIDSIRASRQTATVHEPDEPV